MSSRNTIKLLIAISAGWILICAGIIGIFVYTEMHKPQWQKDSDRAVDYVQSEPKRAIELYRRAIVEAKNDNANIDRRLDLMESCGDALYGDGQFLEAKNVYHDASGIARRSKLIVRQSDFLIYEARAWHEAYKEDLAPIPDEGIVKTALAMRPEKEELPNQTVQMAHLALGEIACDHEQYDKAITYCKKALAEASTLKDGDSKREARLELMTIAIVQNNFKQCNEIFLDGIDDKDGDATSLRADYTAMFREKDRLDSDEDQIQTKLCDWLNKEKFAELDNFFSQDLKRIDELPTGLAMADVHLNYLSDIFEDQNAYEKAVAAATVWNNKFPDSQAARLTLSDLLVNHAGPVTKELEKDGSGADSPEITELFNRAKAVLEGEKVRTASWYRCYQRIAKRYHYDAENFNKITDEAQQKYPRYKRLIFIRAATKLPGQNGSDGDLEKYLDYECKKLPAEEGNILYAQAVMYFENYDTSDVLSSTHLSWDKTKRGLQALIAKHKDWLFGKAFLSSMATVVKDQKVAENAF